MSSEIKIVIADDHPLFREGIRSMLGTQDNFTIVAEANNGKTAFELIEKHRPHVAVLDISMPGMSGFDVARAIREKKLPVEIIILTMYREERLFETAINLGIKGYILKDSARTDIIKGIKAVSKGQPFLSSELSAVILTRLQQNDQQSARNTGIESLSATQRRVLKLISEDKTSKEIASVLCISQRTVETHRAKISSKLNLQGNLALVKYALLHKDEI